MLLSTRLLTLLQLSSYSHQATSTASKARVVVLATTIRLPQQIHEVRDVVYFSAQMLTRSTAPSELVVADGEPVVDR